VIAALGSLEIYEEIKQFG